MNRTPMECSSDARLYHDRSQYTSPGKPIWQSRQKYRYRDLRELASRCWLDIIEQPRVFANQALKPTHPHPHTTFSGTTDATLRVAQPGLPRAEGKPHVARPQAEGGKPGSAMRCDAAFLPAFSPWLATTTREQQQRTFVGCFTHLLHPLTPGRRDPPVW